MKKIVLILVLFFSINANAQLGHLIDSGLYLSGTLYIDYTDERAGQVDSLGYHIMVRVHNNMLIFFKGTEHEVWRPSRFLMYKEDVGPVYQGTDIEILGCKSQMAISRHNGKTILVIRRDNTSFLYVGLAEKIME